MALQIAQTFPRFFPEKTCTCQKKTLILQPQTFEMTKMKTIFTDFCRRNAAFLTGWLLLSVVAVLAICFVPKAELHLLLNRYHTAWLNSFFFHYTHFCNWPMYVLMLLPLLFRRPVWSAVFGATEGLSAIITHVVKYFWNLPRPKLVFEDLAGTHPGLYDAWQQSLVEAVELHSWYSFPSGHTTAFFAFFATLAFLYAEEPKAPCKQEVGLICLILAALGGYSRIYLSQHFLLDVTVGMIIGVLSSVGIFYIFLKKNVNLSAHFKRSH